METPTSDPYLPPEILDYIVDFLEDDIETLIQCCLVSKSWISRARKHIFAVVVFEEEDDLESWKEMFPDPANSPSYHTYALAIGCDPGNMEESGWIRGFPRLEQLIVGCKDWTDPFSLPKLAPSLRALITISSLPHPQIFDLIRSLPFLEVLALRGDVADTDESNGPPAIVPTSSPGGLRLRELELSWCRKQDLPQVAEIVGACSDTLEYLDIGCRVSDDDTLSTIDLSKATNLKEVTFGCSVGQTGSAWIVMALATITSEHRDFQQISIEFFYDSIFDTNIRSAVLSKVGKPGMGWSDLDRLLVQLLESRSIFPTIVCPRMKTRIETVEDLARVLLPGTAKAGTVEVIEEF